MLKFRYSLDVLSLILPTYNEAANIPELLTVLKSVLSMPHEIIIVDDDSKDQTWKVAEDFRSTYRTLRVLRRIGRRGLSSAVTEGFAMATGDVLMVMDADLQHDPHLIVRLYDAIVAGADIAVASRYIEGGSVGDWVTGRRLLSKTATWLAKNVPPVHSTDPMSGFFAINRSSYERIKGKLRPTGFKILLEVLACLPSSSKLSEVPLHFAFRKHGESKLNVWVEVAFVLQLLRIAFGRIQWLLFWLVVLVCVAVLLPRVWALRLFYTDGSVRNQVAAALEATASNAGMPVSDFSLVSVAADHVQLHERDLYRGHDHASCIDVAYSNHAVTPCAD